MTQVRISNSLLSKMTSRADQTTFNQREKKRLLWSWLIFHSLSGMDKIWYFLVFVGSKGLHYTLENNNCFKVCQIMIFTTQATSTISHFLIIKILLSHQTLFSIFFVSWKETTHLIFFYFYFVKSTLKECLFQSVLLSVRSTRQMVALYFVI